MKNTRELTSAQIRTINLLAKGTTLTTAELMHGIPSAGRLLFYWLVKWYLSIIFYCGTAALVQVLLMAFLP